MGINWRGAARGLGEGIADVGRVKVLDETEKLRESRMAKFRQAEIADERVYQDGVRREGYVVQGAMAAQQAEADRAAADLDYERDLDKIRLEGELNPSGTNVTVNNNSGDSDARTRKFGETMGTNDAELANKITTEDYASAKIEDSVNLIESLINEGDTGKGQELLAKAGAWIGTDAASRLQTWQAAVAPLVLAQAESIAGVLSDTDMALLTESVASFGKSTEANRAIIQLLRVGIDRQRENKVALDKWLETHPNLYGFKPPNTQGTRRTGPSDEGAKRPGEAAFTGSATDPLGLLD